MRIGLVSTLSTVVGPDGKGATEQIVSILARELTRRGHEVTVFALAGSAVDGELIATLPNVCGRGGSPSDWQFCEWINLARALELSDRFDILHSHAYLYGLPLEQLARAPMIHTLHVQPQPDAKFLLSLYPKARITALSEFQWSAFPSFRPTAIIYHGVDRSQFTFNDQPDDYVCFLGRFVPNKGALQAIETARAMGLRLLLAGPRNDYFDKRIAPLVDGRSVEYIGPVTGVERDQLLGRARALLYPIQCPEPFGMVMVEAMMCGTPVAAVGLGAVPEIIDDGITGFYARRMEDFPQVVRMALSLNRRLVRERTVTRFSAERMASEYEQVYKQITSRRSV